MKSRLSMHLDIVRYLIMWFSNAWSTVAVPCSHVLDVPQDFFQIPRVCPTRPLKYTVLSSCS